MPGSSARFGPWLFGPLLDLAVFAGSALLGLALVALKRQFGWSEDLPEWGWVAFVLCVDVAHVYATLFRTYFDGAELRRNPLRYAAVPLGVYAAGVALHALGSLVFWRVLAYLAVFHFVRQQVGWAKLYRAKQRSAPVDAVIDQAALYAATIYPLLVWHARLPDTRFAWLVRGDFVDISSFAGALLPTARLLWAAAFSAFVVRQAATFVRTRRLAAGKVALVLGTYAAWYVGIVGTNDDFDFTVTNVLVHGLPYVALLWTYARARKDSETLTGRLAAAGAGAFFAALLLLAFLEESAWDRLVWHDHAALFGTSETTLVGLAATLLVPLLAVPQATHYVLDGLLWRRTEAANGVLAATLDGAEPLIRPSRKMEGREGWVG